MDPDASPRPMTFTCFECRQVVKAGEMEKHLREVHRLSIYGEPLPMEWWKSVLGIAALLVVLGWGRC